MLNKRTSPPATGKSLHKAGEPVHRVIEEPLRPVRVCEIHLYQTPKRNPTTGRKTKESQYDVLFVYEGWTLHHWINDACAAFAFVVTSWMLAGQAAAVGEVRYHHINWDGGWTWIIM